VKKLLSQFVLWYLRLFSSIQLRKINPVVIGIGGASGKSSLSNLTYVILSTKYKVRQGKGKNSETGIPLDILRLSPHNYGYFDWFKILLKAPLKALTDNEKYDYYIAEMGIDSPLEPKNMTYLLKIVEPKIATLTNVSLEHSVYFDPLVKDGDIKKRREDIFRLTAEQEGLLLTSVDEDGTAVINADDETINDLKPRIRAKKITVSKKDKTADFYIEEIRNFVDKFLIKFTNKGEKYELFIENPLPEHFAYSFLLAIGIAVSCNISVQDSISALEKDFSLPPGRMSFFKGVKDTILIDSSYNNATLTPILDLLGFVKEVGKQRRRVGIIGDMRELGTMSKALHEEVAKKILETLDLVILIGPLSQQYVLPLLKKNKFPSYSFLNFTSSKEAIIENVKPKDMVLIKGSQNTLFLERAVEMLLKNPQDKEKLCRRGDYWEAIRKKTL
jgi:UDP-N-acetylmuramoyl-tripeptide--D-alanyl-D-alanine ligase